LRRPLRAEAPYLDPKLNWTTGNSRLLRLRATPIYHVVSELYSRGLLYQEMGDIASYCRVHGRTAVLAIRLCAADVFDTGMNENRTILGECIFEYLLTVEEFSTCESNGLVLQPGMDCGNPKCGFGNVFVLVFRD